MAKNPPEQGHSHWPHWHNLPAFQRMQYEFAAWIRTPDPTHTPQNIERRRMNVYRELFFGNMCAFVENTFPVAKDIIKDVGGQNQWQPLMEQFFAEHLAKSPYFRDIPVEFMTWLQNNPEKLEHLPPWLLELLHYEWLELEIGARDSSTINRANENYDADGWPSESWPGGFGERPPKSGERPVLSPFFDMAAYQFPVHQISADYQPDTPPEAPTFLAVYRRRDNRVRFMELTPQVALLLQALSENPDATPQDALHVVEQQTGGVLGEAWLDQTLADLYEREIVSAI